MAAQNKIVIPNQPVITHEERAKQSALSKPTKQSLVPKLRFKEFEGEWAIDMLKTRIDSIDSGWSPQCEESPALNDEWGVLKTTAVVWEGFNQNANKKLPETLDPRPNLQVVEEDILITRAGPASRVGVAVYVNEVRSKLMLSDKLIRIKVNDITSSLFLSISLGNRAAQRQLVSKSSGLAESQTNISQKILLNTRLLLPALPEQQKIASFLSAVDQKIQQLTQKKALLEDYKKGVMQQLFSQQLRFKIKNEVGELVEPPDWEEKRLGDICLINPKSSKLPSSFIYIDLESVFKGQLVKENRIELNHAPSRAQRSLLADDILYQTVRPYQKNNLFFSKSGDYVASTGYAQLRAKENAMFIYQLMHFNGFVNKVLMRCTGTSFPAINSKDLAKIIVSVPVIEEQQKIAGYLSSIDAKIEQVNQQIEKTQLFKKGLLQQMFV